MEEGVGVQALGWLVCPGDLCSWVSGLGPSEQTRLGRAVPPGWARAQV